MIAHCPTPRQRLPLLVMTPRERREPPQRNGKLAIPLPFDEAMKAALEVKPAEKTPRKPRAKRKSAKR